MLSITDISHDLAQTYDVRPEAVHEWIMGLKDEGILRARDFSKEGSKIKDDAVADCAFALEELVNDAYDVDNPDPSLHSVRISLHTIHIAYESEHLEHLKANQENHEPGDLWQIATRAWRDKRIYDALMDLMPITMAADAANMSVDEVNDLADRLAKAQ